MKIDQLRILLEVAQHGNFAAVAEEREVNASSISRSIAILEKLIGVRLFQRTTRKVILTKSGEEFVARISHLVDNLDHAIDDVRAVNSQPKGVLKMTASVAFGEKMILPLVPVFKDRYPEVKLNLNFTDSVVDLVSGGVDLAIRLAASVKGDVVQTKLMNTRYYVCATPKYLAKAAPIIEPIDLSAHQCVLFNLPAYKSEWLFKRKNELSDENVNGIPVQGDITMVSAISLRTLTLLDVGPSLLPDWLVDEDIKNGRLVNIFPDYMVSATNFNTSAWALYSSRTYLPNKVRVMIDFLRSHLGDRETSRVSPKLQS